MESVIYIVTSNSFPPGNEVIHGFYPTRAIAEARKEMLLADEDFQDGDTEVAVLSVPVGPEGADTYIRLR